VLVTAIVTYTQTRRRLLDDLTHDYDLALRSNRVEVYPGLWHLTEALPRYGKQRPVTISDLRETIDQATRERLRESGSSLRGTLTEDIRSRERTVLGEGRRQA
jgi:hypothetical protein